MTEYPYYNWKHEPDDGEYELQFGEFKTSEGGDKHDLVALLIVDPEADEAIGEVYYPTVYTPGSNRGTPLGRRFFMVSSKITKLWT